MAEVQTDATAQETIVDPWANEDILEDGDILDMGDGVEYADDPEDDQVVVNPDADPEQGDESKQEPEEESDPEEKAEAESPEENEPDGDVTDQQEESVFDPEKWDGNVDSLPAELQGLAKPVLKNMERGLQMRFQEVAKLRRAYEAKLEAATQPPSTPAQAEGPPPPPGEGATQDQWMDWNRQQVQYFTKQEVEKALGDRLPDVAATADSIKRLEADRRMSMLTSQDGFSDAVAQKMTEIADANPHWQDGLRDSDERTLELFGIAKGALDLEESRKQLADKEVQVQKAEATETKHKASSANRAVSRPGTSRKTAGPAERFAGTFSFDDPESMGRLDAEVVEAYDRQARST